jgi:alanyl-tRNA synthetase
MPERLYYSDSFLSSFEARVSDIREISRNQGQPVWQIALDRTAFYPTSGGQPHDTGSVTATAASGTTLRAPILAVDEDDAGEVWHTTTKPLLAGTAVRAEIDWDRRVDHIQQHSGQHLLSAAFVREIGATTVSFHLGESSSTIDLAVETVTDEELKHVEEAANRIALENRPVTARIVARGEAEELLAKGLLKKLPERDGTIRLIEIEGFDLNACGGTHVRATGQIGCVLIRGTERVKQGVRVEFVCGLRSVGSAQRDLTTLTRAASSLSLGRDLVPDGVDRLIAENKAGSKERQRLREDLAQYHACRLLVECPIENGLRLVRRGFSEYDLQYIKLLASRLTASAPQTCALMGSTEEDPAKVVLSSSQDLPVDCGKTLRDALAAHGLRGGGSKTMAQGQVPAAKMEALFDAVEAALRQT